MDSPLEGTGFELLVRGRVKRLSRLLTRPVAWDGSAAGGATRPPPSALRERIALAVLLSFKIADDTISHRQNEETGLPSTAIAKSCSSGVGNRSTARSYEGYAPGRWQSSPDHLGDGTEIS